MEVFTTFVLTLHRIFNIFYILHSFQFHLNLNMPGMKNYCLLLILLVLAGCAAAQEITRSFREDFSDDSLKNFRYGSTGTKSNFKWKSGAASASDNRLKILSFKIDPADSAGAGRGPEIISNQFTHFGTYSSRLKVPDVRKTQPNTGAVVGYFTYYMDSLAGLSEIDFEWLVADPTIIYIGTWTGARGQLKRIGRTINLATGLIYNTSYRAGYQGTNVPLSGAQNQPEKISAIAGYDASAAFYTYGFDWSGNCITWWIINPLDNKKMILWDYQGSLEGIPQNATLYRLNFWHTNNWPVETNPASLEKPAQPYALEVDWMSYDALKQ
jgi:beta-glucanase (GH16 family)